MRMDMAKTFEPEIDGARPPTDSAPWKNNYAPAHARAGAMTTAFQMEDHCLYKSHHARTWNLEADLTSEAV